MVFFLMLSACGYQFEGSKNSKDQITVTVPYVQGDGEGELTNALTKALAESGRFCYAPTGGELTLQVAIVSAANERVGYRYDRHGPHGKRGKNLVGIENRKVVAVQIAVIDAVTEEILMPPTIVKAVADYDYYDPDDIRDLTATTATGGKTKVISFSLGQLDSIEGASDDVNTPLFRRLAEQIVGSMINAQFK
jgi:outer membrane lipopolysaccharide assembly protein LptE/RlpB